MTKTEKKRLEYIEQAVKEFRKIDWITEVWVSYHNKVGNLPVIVLTLDDRFGSIKIGVNNFKNKI